MKCPDIEDLLKFAANPLLEENVEIAAHINECDECSNTLREINDIMYLEDSSPCTDEELAELDAFLEKKKKSETLWTKLSQLLEEVSSKVIPDPFEGINEGVMGICHNFLGDSLFSGIGMAAAHYSSKRESESDIPIEEVPIKIAFVSDCEIENAKYWKAEIIIPYGIPPEHGLTILLTNRKGNTIKSGTFVLLGNELRVSEGICSIKLSDFQKSLKNTEVRFVGVDGQESYGSLFIC